MTQIPVAIVGISALFPGSTDSLGFWRDIFAGTDLIKEVPPTHWLIEDYYDPDPSTPDRTYSKRGAFLSDVAFDPLEFGIPPNIVPATDTSQLLALIVAQRVLADATGGQFEKLDRERASVILGVTSGQELLGTMVSRLQKPIWLKALRDAGVPEDEAQGICERIAREYVPWQESTFPGLLGNVVAGRIANRFDLRGTNCVVDAACASALSALSMGLNELASGQSDLVIAGGVDTMNDIFMYMCFSKTPALSRAGDCRPFSEAADGTLLGEGIAMVALRRLEDAERDGDKIYAVIRGLGSSSDGRSKSVYAPLPAGQARALERTYEVAGYGPETVELVEAHGTATKAGDAAESEGLRMVFGAANRADRPWCALGSVKSQIGHLKSAAGAAGLFKAALALQHKVLPPIIKVGRPNPALGLEGSPFYLNTRSRPWIRDSSHPRRASVSSFGFGGSNFHVTLEEYVGPGKQAPRVRTDPTELVVLSASDVAGLIARSEEVAKVAGADGLFAAAYASYAAFRAGDSVRVAVVASDPADLGNKLGLVRGHLQAHPEQSLSTPTGVHVVVGDAAGKLAFLFPGQGSQYVDMTADVVMRSDAARGVWDGCAGLRFADEALHDVVFPRSVFNDEDAQAQAARLTATEWAQPAIGAASLGLLAVLRAAGVRPDQVAGHSFGELTALAAAGVVSETDLVAMARRRGELMRGGDGAGAMIAVVRTIAEVRADLAEFEHSLVVANHNHPTQVVLSGATAEVERVERHLSGKGVTVRRLPVANAFHSPLVAPAVLVFEDFLRTLKFSAPEIPVWSGAEVAHYSHEAGAIRTLLAGAIARPVRFVEQVEAMYAQGVRTFVEVGPGAVLGDLVGRILEGRPHTAIALDRRGKHGVTCMQEALGRLATLGVAVDFNNVLSAGFAPPATSVGKKKPAMTIMINGANHGKPYPPPGGAAALPKANAARAETPSNGAGHHVAAAGPSNGAGHHVAAGPSNGAGQPAAAAGPSNGVGHHAAAAGPSNGVGQPAAGPSNGAGQHGAVAAVTPSYASGQTVAAGTSYASGQFVAAGDPVRAAWVQAYQDSQAQTAEVHTAYIKMMADSHAAFLRTVETSFMGMSALLGGRAPEGVVGHAPIAAPIAAPAPVYAAPAPVYAPAPVAAPVYMPVHVAPVHVAVPVHVQAAPVVQAVAAAPVAAAPVAAKQDLEGLMLAVVAEMTGYPRETLELHMELEADLGIDSIKRVEILSGLRERAPGLPEVKANEMAALRTLGQIVDYMRASGGGAAPANAPVAATAPTNAKSSLAPIPAAAVAVPVAATRGASRRFVTVPVAAPAPGLALAGLAAARWVAVTDCGGGVAGQVVRALAERGIKAEVVDAITGDPDAVIFLGGLRKVASVDEAIAVNHAAFRCAKAVASRYAAKGGVFVTVQDTGGDFGMAGRDEVRAWLAGVSALARTAAIEWPDAVVRAIDLECGGRSPEVVARAVVDELLGGGATREVGLRADGTRTTLRSEEREVVAGAPVLAANDVVVVSGGARGVTAASVVALARTVPLRLVLLGRSRCEAEPAACRGVTDEGELRKVLYNEARGRGETRTPAELGALAAQVVANREVEATLAAIRAAGSEVRYVAVDVADRERVRAALAEVRTAWGPITGVVHGAGLLADRWIADKTDEQFNRVFAAKVEGLRALVEATAGDPLKLFAVFSSVAARTGNAGQCDYAMANEVLNKVTAALRRGRGVVARAIGWGPWDGGMVTPSLAAKFEQAGVGILGLAEGARRFVEELRAPLDEIEVVIGGAAGEGPLGGAGGPAMNVELNVDERSHRQLADHRLAGRPVVPLAVVVDWLARAARSYRPGSVITLRDVRVLRGIKLAGFEKGGDRFMVKCKPGASGELALELRGADGTLHYSATAGASAGFEALAKPTLGGWTGTIYDGHTLFHGPGFQVITAIEGVSREGIAGTLDGARARGWVEESWFVDPAMLDGAIQLAVLWAKGVLGGASLPMAVGAFTGSGEGASAGPVRCVVRGREVHAARAVCDVVMQDAAGRTIAELRGLETVLRPGEPTT